MTEQIEGKSIFGKIIQSHSVRIIISLIWLITIYMGTQSLIKTLPVKGTILISILLWVIMAVIVYLSYYAFVRIIEKRPVTELGKSNSLKELAIGILVGALLFSFTIGILWVIGCYKVSGTNPWTIAISSFFVSIYASIFEEILFRGVLFRIIEQRTGTWIALFISALIFGLQHLSNPGSDFAVAVMVALESGVLLASAYVLTRRLWFVIGLHFSWNFIQGGIFGLTVSGIQSNGILKSTLPGSELLTGGNFGAEASIVAVIICTFAAIFMLWKAKQKDNFIKPSWIQKKEITQPQNTADSQSGVGVAN